MNTFSVLIAKKNPRKPTDDFLDSAPPYYRTYLSDNQVKVASKKDVKVIDRGMLSLLQNMKSQRILVVSHGMPRGFLSFAVESTKLAQWQLMAALVYALEIRRFRAKVQPSSTANDWAKLYGMVAIDWKMNKESEAIAALGTNHRNKAYAHGATEYPHLGKTKTAKHSAVIAGYNKWFTDFATKTGLSSDKVDSYIKALGEVHKLEIERLEIRGCRIGKYKNVLRIIRRFFNAKTVRAPKIFNHFGEAAINILTPRDFRKRYGKLRSARARRLRRRGRVPAPKNYRLRKPTIQTRKSDEFLIEFTGRGEYKMWAEGKQAAVGFVRTRLGMPAGLAKKITAEEDIPWQWLSASRVGGIKAFPKRNTFLRYLRVVKD